MSVTDLTGRILVDTNVLIYATLKWDERHERANEVLALRTRRDIELFVSVQNLSEMYPNLTGPKNQPPDTPELARQKIQSIAALRGLTVLPLSWQSMQQAVILCEQLSVTRQRYFDCQLAGLMIQEGIPMILTENTKDFSGIRGITAQNPFLG